MGASCCTEGLGRLFSSEAPKQDRARLRASLLSPSAAALPGTPTIRHSAELGEAYDVTSELFGVGTFGIIRRARAKGAGAAVCALKTVETQKLPCEALEALANEIRIQGACSHPNIVGIYECFDGPEEFHIAMEACEGGDLRDYLFSTGNLADQECRYVMAQLLRGVIYMHEVMSVVHRDLKPENLLLKYRGADLEENTLMISDFGLATPFTSGERGLSVVCGTPEYLAPEVSLGRYDEKCDTWACGIILYEILTGALPYEDSSPSHTMLLARVCPLPQPPRPVREEAFDLVRSLCQKDPRQRPSAQEAHGVPWLQGVAGFKAAGSSASSVTSTTDVDTQSSGESAADWESADASPLQPELSEREEELACRAATS